MKSNVRQRRPGDPRKIIPVQLRNAPSKIRDLTEENEQKTKRILELEKDADRYRLTMKQYIEKL